MNLLILIILTLALAAFFSGMETALFRYKGVQKESVRNPEVPPSELAQLITDHSPKHIAALRTGKIIAIAMAAISLYLYFSEMFSGMTSSAVAIIMLSLIASSITIFIFAQLIPVTIARVSPSILVQYMSAPSMFFYLLLHPLEKGILRLSRFFTGKDPDEDELYTRTDIYDIPVTENESEKDLDSNRNNIRLFRNILDLSNVKVREIMVPRTEIEAVQTSVTIAQLREKFVLTRFSRILVYHDSIDDIKGYFEVKDLFGKPDDIMSVLRKISIVPETMQASKLLKMFVDEKRSIALVVDEFGGTSGMITIEDLLEEIVGDIEDEHDSKDLVERIVRPNEYILSGRLEIDYLNEKYNLDLPEGSDFETLAGMILFYHGSMPGNNETVKIGKFTIKILRASSTRLELVNLRLE
jgi:CBS domain containing-hemolysin-like protein